METSGEGGTWELLTGGFTALYDLFSSWIGGIAHSGISFSIPVLILFFLSAAVFLLSAFWAGSIAESRGHNPLMHMLLGIVFPFLYPLGILLLLKRESGEETQAEEAPKAEKPKLKTKNAGIQFKEAPSPVPAEGETDAAATGSATADKAGKQEEKMRGFSSRKPLPSSAGPADGKKAESSRQGKSGNAPTTEKGNAALSPAEAGDGESVSVRKELDPAAKLDMGYLTSIAVNEDGTAAGPFILELVDGQELEVLRIMNPMETLSVLEIPGVKSGDAPRNVRLPYAKMKSIRYKDAAPSAD